MYVLIGFENTLFESIFDNSIRVQLPFIRLQDFKLYSEQTMGPLE